jgi:hypothetical protein
MLDRNGNNLAGVTVPGSSPTAVTGASISLLAAAQPLETKIKRPWNTPGPFSYLMEII